LWKDTSTKKGEKETKCMKNEVWWRKRREAGEEGMELECWIWSEKASHRGGHLEEELKQARPIWGTAPGRRNSKCKHSKVGKNRKVNIDKGEWDWVKPQTS
jgi:hypothetical protein